MERDSLKERVRTLESELKQHKPDGKNDIELEAPIEEKSPEKTM